MPDSVAEAFEQAEANLRGWEHAYRNPRPRPLTIQKKKPLTILEPPSKRYMETGR